MKISSLTVGQEVYDVHSCRMGNTTIRTMGCWTVRIKEVDPEGRFVVASWNHNAPEKFWAGSVKKWRAKKPIFIKSGLFGQRLATRAEIKAMQA